MKGSDYEKVEGDPGLVQSDGTATGPAPTGVWPHKWVVAYDVLTVVVNPDNTWAEKLTFDQLYEVFTDDDPALYWDDISGLESAPHNKIEIYAPDESSGTYDYFFESIIPGWGKDEQQANTRLDSGDKVYQPSSDDNVILNAISDNKYAIGFFGFAFYIDNPGKVTTVSISKNQTTFITPSFETVAEYPMARPLFIYTDGIPGEKLKAWLFTVTRNRALDELRKESRMNPLAEVTLNTKQDIAPSPSEKLEKKETTNQVQLALNTLPDNQKEIIRLKFQECLSYKEISEITGHSVSNVGVLIPTAVKKMREQLLAQS